MSHSSHRPSDPAYCIEDCPTSSSDFKWNLCWRFPFQNLTRNFYGSSRSILKLTLELQCIFFSRWCEDNVVFTRIFDSIFTTYFHNLYGNLYGNHQLLLPATNFKPLKTSRLSNDKMGNNKTNFKQFIFQVRHIYGRKLFSYFHWKVKKFIGNTIMSYMKCLGVFMW